MNQAQYASAAAVYAHDYSSVNATFQMLNATLSPDPKAEELKQRLIQFLTKAMAKANPSPGAGPRQSPSPEQELLNEYSKWRSDYDAWLKSAAPRTDQ